MHNKNNYKCNFCKKYKEKELFKKVGIKKEKKKIQYKYIRHGICLDCYDYRNRKDTVSKNESNLSASESKIEEVLRLFKIQYRGVINKGESEKYEVMKYFSDRYMISNQKLKKIEFELEEEIKKNK